MAATDPSRSKSLVKIGGALGIAASFIGIAIFTVAAFGLYAVFMLSPLPLAFGIIGMVLSIVGSVVTTHHGEEENYPIAALFVCLFGIIFGALEVYAWWHIR